LLRELGIFLWTHVRQEDIACRYGGEEFTLVLPDASLEVAQHRAVFTDPVVITGPVTNDELALRSSIGLFLFVPPGINEQLIASAGFQLVQQEDITENAALIAGRWHEARGRYKEALRQIEGAERFVGLQEFFAAVHHLTSERRLSRIVYLVEKLAS